MPNGHITEDLERERSARRIVDLALKETLDSLEETLEHLEETILMLAEVGIRFPDAKVLNEDFQGESEFGYLIAAKMYENYAKRTRIKFNLPPGDHAPSSGDSGNGSPSLPSSA